MGSPVLITLTLTFGLNLVLYNLMILAFKADFRKVILSPPLGSVNIGGVIVPVDRLISTAFALAIVGLLYVLLRASRIGRAIVAVRMDREASLLMGVKVSRIYAITFGLGAAMAGAAGSLFSVIFPISPESANALSGQGFRDLRARRIGQRAGRGRRRTDARRHRELCGAVLRTRAFDHDLVLAADPAVDVSAERNHAAGGVSNDAGSC